VLNEGNNYSAGERQLRECTKADDGLTSVSLLRALVRGCKVLLLDEATSSVDPETDAIIQRIVQTEFSDVTVGSHLPPDGPAADIIVIAHLNCTPTANRGVLRQDPGSGSRQHRRGELKASVTR
jgi:ABC-type transport system involved in cytochrome bd biosynthesis fused ATPase/permease subunit